VGVDRLLLLELLFPFPGVPLDLEPALEDGFEGKLGLLGSTFELRMG